MPYIVFPLLSLGLNSLEKDKIKERSEDKFLIQAIVYDEPDTSLDVKIILKSSFGIEF